LINWRKLYTPNPSFMTLKYNYWYKIWKLPYTSSAVLINEKPRKFKDAVALSVFRILSRFQRTPNIDKIKINKRVLMHCLKIY
jgi:hypothetical protein